MPFRGERHPSTAILRGSIRWGLTRQLTSGVGAFLPSSSFSSFLLSEQWLLNSIVLRHPSSFRVAALTGFMHSAHQLYVVRFLLGLAEAGFAPAMLLVSNLLVPAARSLPRRRCKRATHLRFEQYLGPFWLERYQAVAKTTAAMVADC